MSSTASSEDANLDLIIEEDVPVAQPPELAPWRVLIVDDDVDVHVVTKFALSNASFQGRRLSFLHAYSGKEALVMLRDTPDIALVLLDVIMESDDAGLQVARQVREVLGNNLTRIVLRTGQPGQALEHSIIVDYDINDFWCKADLTTRKLFTTVIAALRAYAGLVGAARAREALHAALVRLENVHAALDKHALVLTLDEQAKISEVNDKACHLLQLRRDALLGRSALSLHPAPFPVALRGDIRDALAEHGKWAGDVLGTARDGSTHKLRATIVAFRDPFGKTYQYVVIATPLAGA